MSRCHFVPPYLLERLAGSDAHPDVSCSGRDTLAVDEEMRRARLSHAVHAERPATEAGPPAWAVYTDSNGTTLPGAEVREAGQPDSGDAAVDEAAVSVSATLAMYDEVLHRSSYDGGGARVLATVHYGSNYDNAFWNGTQLVFGDGDGQVFGRFTTPIDVGAHEFTHAVTQYTAGLTYSGQSGALNESVSDVFASCLKQRVRGQTAAEADWLIGAGIFEPSVRGRALRSMAAPGTAYDDPVLGKDPQVASMADYVETDSDNGGVHVNSGIPNRAFYLAATALGGRSWQTAGPIWYAALTAGIGAGTDFAGFAAACVEAAGKVSPAAVDAVRAAWQQVGVEAPGVGVPAGPVSGRTTSDGLVAVTRSGGFAGLQRSGMVHLGDDPRTAEVERLLDRIDFRAVRPPVVPLPDRFVYVFSVRGQEFMVGEQDLTGDLERLALVVLDD